MYIIIYNANIQWWLLVYFMMYGFEIVNIHYVIISKLFIISHKIFLTECATHSI